MSQNYSASNFKPKTAVKISEPGIYSNLKLKDTEFSEGKFFKVAFEREDDSYCDVRVFLEINEDNIRKGQTTLFAKKK